MILNPNNEMHDEKELWFEPPRTWDELKALQLVLPFSATLARRFEHEIRFYKQIKQTLGKEKFLELILNQIGSDEVKLLPNNFRFGRLLYHLPYIEHLILWSKNTLSKEQIDDYLMRQLGETEYFWYENNPNSKSVPEINHVHVFVNRSNIA